MNDFDTGAFDAKIDLDEGWIPVGGPTEKPAFPTLDYIVNELRMTLDASDEYIAGYLSEIYKPCCE